MSGVIICNIYLTFNLQAPEKYVSFIHVCILNCPYFGD